MLATRYYNYRPEYKEGMNSHGIVVSSLFLYLVFLF